jgi:hypothetical protein
VGGDAKMKKILMFLFCSMMYSTLAISGEKVYHSKIKSINPEMVDGQYCSVKIIIKEVDDTIIKEEILECADGRNKFDSPGYWEMFAEFYYRDVNTPEYCRSYSRSGHAFKSFGKVCMNKNGEWERK